jgi:AcrR family transcriptional regulator
MTKAETERREQILTAARELVTERGARTNVTMQAVAERAGITKVTLYRYFPSKEVLFAEVAATLDAGTDLPDRRDQIVAAAVRVIPTYGFHGVTMERIADEAGVSPATLYWYFKNKDDLLLAIVERMIGRIDFTSFFPQTPIEDAEAFVTAVVPRLIHFLDERISLMPIVLAEVSTHPELAEAIYRNVYSQIWPVVIAFMDKQVQSGVFRPGHPLLRIHAIIGMLLIYTLARRNFGAFVDIPSPELAAHEFADLFLHGVMTDDSGG